MARFLPVTEIGLNQAFGEQILILDVVTHVFSWSKSRPQQWLRRLPRPVPSISVDSILPAKDSRPRAQTRFQPLDYRFRINWNHVRVHADSRVAEESSTPLKAHLRALGGMISAGIENSVHAVYGLPELPSTASA